MLKGERLRILDVILLLLLKRLLICLAAADLTELGVGQISMARGDMK